MWDVGPLVQTGKYNLFHHPPQEDGVQQQPHRGGVQGGGPVDDHLQGRRQDQQDRLYHRAGVHRGFAHQ